MQFLVDLVTFIREFLYGNFIFCVVSFTVNLSVLENLGKLNKFLGFLKFGCDKENET